MHCYNLAVNDPADCARENYAFWRELENKCYFYHELKILTSIRDNYKIYELYCKRRITDSLLGNLSEIYGSILEHEEKIIVNMFLSQIKEICKQCALEERETNEESYWKPYPCIYEKQLQFILDTHFKTFDFLYCFCERLENKEGSHYSKGIKYPKRKKRLFDWNEELKEFYPQICNSCKNLNNDLYEPILHPSLIGNYTRICNQKDKNQIIYPEILIPCSKFYVDFNVKEEKDLKPFCYKIIL